MRIYETKFPTSQMKVKQILSSQIDLKIFNAIL